LISSISFLFKLFFTLFYWKGVFYNLIFTALPPVLLAEYGHVSHVAPGGNQVIQGWQLPELPFLTDAHCGGV
jgi:hypothetical protein